MFSASLSLFSRETEFMKFVSEEIATSRSRHASRRRRIQARAGIVAFISCCLARLSNGGLGFLGETVSRPACSEVFAVVLLWRAAWTRWLSVVKCDPATKHFLSMCFTEQPSQIQNQPLPSRPQKISSPLVSVCPFVLHLYRCSIVFPHALRMMLANPEEPRRAWRGLLIHCRDPTAMARLRTQNKLACLFPPSTLDPRLASGAFAVAKGKGRDAH